MKVGKTKRGTKGEGMEIVRDEGRQHKGEKREEKNRKPYKMKTDRTRGEKSGEYGSGRE